MQVPYSSKLSLPQTGELALPQTHRLCAPSHFAIGFSGVACSSEKIDSIYSNGMFFLVQGNVCLDEDRKSHRYSKVHVALQDSV